MSLIDDIKAKADQNGDGKISAEDLEGLKNGLNDDQLNKLKELADRNGDHKIDLKDLENFDFNSLVQDAKDTLGGLFGDK